ncbi:MAG: ATP-binding protein [Chitinispirillia bacterium]|nr:ATP-binding protein [Chitinispirillia bacterium]
MEHQNTEYKSDWKDEYLRGIYGFANAQDGTLFIGKNDLGDVVGLKNAKKLLVDLPNKITAVLGIVANVNLHQAPLGSYWDAMPVPGVPASDLKPETFDFLVQKKIYGSP